jgi:hypothetical protein
LPEAFKNIISKQEWSFFLVIEVHAIFSKKKVHANEVTTKINKGPSNPSLAKKMTVKMGKIENRFL